ncbi:uncharacterized protein LOC123321010 [Coccinella septempunctata]|uniref:uncharacterized protein LOC123321010 n=1 Tax=Coccinella septempunctata TaxID=41139 RepID=UPI001D08F342|nr:uncharacterized protein LOC123321010 [Coccinella septempunctata]
MNQSDYSLFDIFGITSELQPSPQQLSNEELEMILRLEETKSFAESNNINQPDFSLSNKHGVSFESEQSFSQHCEKVLCSEKAKVSSASNNFDNFGMIHGQLTDVEFERILGLGESNVSAESATQINRSHSDQYMTDWNSLFEQEPIEIDDMFNGHSSHQAPDTQLRNSIISPDSGICDEGLAESDSSSSTPPTYSQIFEVKDQCLQQKECYRTSVPKSTPYVFKTNSGLWKNRNYEIVESVRPTSMIPKSDVIKPKVRIREGVRKLQKQKVFKCSKCEFSSYFRDILDQHIHRTHLQPNQECKQIQSNERVNFTINGKEKAPHSSVANRASIRSKKFTCTDCSFPTTDLRIFLNHIFVIHKYRWYKCPICRVCTTSPNASMEHFRKNPDHMIPYGKINSQKKIIQPRREKKYRYKSDENLNIEVKKEGNKEKIVITPKPHCFKKGNKIEKKFYCEVCEFKTLSYSTLMVHKNRNHNLAMRCPGCFRHLNSIAELIKHLMDSPNHMTTYLRFHL